MDVDHYSSENGAIIAEISATALKKLKLANYSFEVLVDDVSKHFLEESKSFFRTANAGLGADQGTTNKMAIEASCTRVTNFISTPTQFTTNGIPQGSMGGYFTYSEMNSEMNALVSAFPSLVQKFSLGNSIEGRAIWCLKISDNVSTDENNEPEVLYLGLQHAREAITGTSLIFFAQYLAQNYSSGQAIQDLVNNREIFIVPCVNPDGYFFNEDNDPGGGGMQRKNRRNVGSDATGQKGVDLNRNYGVDWADCAGASSSCGSSSTSAETYWGANAFSEPETQAIRNFCYTRNFVAAFDQHCSGPYYSLPFGRRSYHSMTGTDSDFYTFIPALMGKYNGHRAGDSEATVNYEVAGGVKDWWLMGDIETFPGQANKKGKIFGMTGEAGGGGFWAPSSQIIELCKNLCFQNLQLACAAGSYIDIQDIGDIAISSHNPSLDFRIRRIGLGNDPVTISVLPLENIQAVSAAVTVTSLPGYFDTYAGSIAITIPAALGNGQKIKFAWKVETGGITTYDTVVKIYNPINVFGDNMDTGPVSGVWTVTGGWDYTSSFANSGTRSLTESPGGNYSTSSTRIAAYKEIFDLSDATTAYISFSVRHRSENFRDKLRIQLSTNSTDGIDGNWTSLCGLNTVQETNTTNGGTLGGQPALTGIRENWTRELIEIPASFYASDTIRFRFEFSSDNDGSPFEGERDDGFYIDDFKMVKSTTPLVSLPTHFISFSGVLLPEGVIRLDWNAQTDEMHDHFEVEKSIDGISFYYLGEGNVSSSYWAIDPFPENGNNFYRIKQIDKDGRTTYSNIVNVLYKRNSARLAAYPNPVNDLLQVVISSPLADQYNFALTSLVGTELYREKVVTGVIAKKLSIDMSRYASGIYILTARNKNNEVMFTQKVVKQ
jgi:hypothetical protein